MHLVLGAGIVDVSEVYQNVWIESFDLLKQVNGILCAGTPVAEKRDFGVGGNGGGKDVVQSLAVRDRASTQFEKVHVLVDALGPERVTHVEIEHILENLDLIVGSENLGLGDLEPQRRTALDRVEPAHLGCQRAAESFRRRCCFGRRENASGIRLCDISSRS